MAGVRGYSGAYGLSSAMLFELIATFLFCVVILGSAQEGATSQIAGLAIGIALVVIHIFGIQITGVSVNPARSLGSALFAGTKAICPGLVISYCAKHRRSLAGVLFRSKVLEN